MACRWNMEPCSILHQPSPSACHASLVITRTRFSAVADPAMDSKAPRAIDRLPLQVQLQEPQFSNLNITEARQVTYAPFSLRHIHWLSLDSKTHILGSVTSPACRRGRICSSETSPACCILSKLVMFEVCQQQTRLVRRTCMMYLN